jgi:hypothetical protein
VLILKDFLFRSLFKTFRKHFEFERPPKANIKHAYYKWGDFDYDEFMLKLMASLMPR